jgi:TPR repeat protein
MFRLFKVSSLALILVAWAASADAQSGRNHPAPQSDDARVVRDLNNAAKSGEAAAQLELGRAYREGKGVAADAGQAYRWIRKAAEQDLPDAQFETGQMEEEGDGTEENLASAAEWYRKAADKGYAPAMVALAELYRTGHGVAEDPAEAARWYRMAADKNDIDGQLALGDLYRQGLGVPQSPSYATMWYRKAAELGSPEGRTQLALMLLNGGAIPPLTRAPSRIQVEAMGWLSQAADQGYAPAQYYLGMAALNGVDATLDPKAAVDLLEKAADQAHVPSLRQLGLLYVEGKVVGQDLVRAFMYFDLAARLGDQMASGDRDELAGTLPAAQQQLGKRRAQEWLQLRGMS